MTCHYPNHLPFRKSVWQMLSLLYFGGQQTQEFSRGIDNSVKLNPLDLAIDWGSFFYQVDSKGSKRVEQKGGKNLMVVEHLFNQYAISGLDPQLEQQTSNICM